ncbi:MAG: flagellar basal body P-ring protein FlgI [Planctomycetes bacterium]|nr:flagellar basal body P-ring protein FlgI [Planctomycetota bacterium]
MTPAKTSILVAFGAAVLLAGCGPRTNRFAAPADIPVDVRGTVGQYAMYVGYSQRPVQGYGLLLGLGENGSAEVPQPLQDRLTEELGKQNLGFYRYGTAHLSPSRILRDLDTAVVRITGSIPYGATVGTRFDLRVSALSQTQTRSLDGGRMLPFPLRLDLGSNNPAGRRSSIWATASGEMFLNPYIELDKPGELIKLREGRIINGGRVIHEQPVVLLLGRADYSMSSKIAALINTRFGKSYRRVATAKNDRTIEVQIPREFHDDYTHFLDLVLHLPLGRGEGFDELRIREVLEALGDPKSQHAQLSLALEAAGEQVIGLLQSHYASPKAHVAFYTARAGLRLGDRKASGTILRFAVRDGSPYQVSAIKELARVRGVAGSVRVLRKLVNSEDEFVRLAAYEALVANGDAATVQSSQIGQRRKADGGFTPGRFTLDIVKSTGKPVIYASQFEETKIVIFGADMRVKSPMFLSFPDELVTVGNVKIDGEDKLMVYRRIPRGRVVSDAFYIDFSVASLIRTMGSAIERGDDGKIQGLALTYSQVLRVLAALCASGDIDARFILQRPPALRRIYRDIEPAEEAETTSVP